MQRALRARAALHRQPKQHRRSTGSISPGEERYLSNEGSAAQCARIAEQRVEQLRDPAHVAVELTLTTARPAIADRPGALVGNGMQDHVVITNHAANRVSFEAALELEADFADILTVKETRVRVRRAPRGASIAPARPFPVRSRAQRDPLRGRRARRYCTDTGRLHAAWRAQRQSSVLAG